MKVKKIFCLFLVSILFFIPIQQPIYAESTFKLPHECISYALADGASGKILVGQNIQEKLQIASITKIMTLLLLCEKIDRQEISLNDIFETSEHAKSITGSKIYLEVGEQMSVSDLIKAIAVASANDAAIVVAENIAGTEEDFVKLMNDKAQELGMKNSHFATPYGFDDPQNYSTAEDIVIMAKELLTKHEWIKEYTTLYSIELRDGKSQYFNSNKLVNEKYGYPGCTGLKTGTDTKAGPCLCCSATRGDMSLIAVVLNVDTTIMDGTNARQEDCKYLLDYGFSSFKVLNTKIDEEDLVPVKILRGVKSCVAVDAARDFMPIMIKKGASANIEKIAQINEDIEAPVRKGDVVGNIVYSLEGKPIFKVDVTAKEDVDKIGFGFIFFSIVKNFFAGCKLT